ncbi:MAG: alpha/beta hydrolase [Planctomycetota bacterium]
MRLTSALIVWCLIVVAPHALAQTPAASFEAPDDIAFRTMSFYSDGTRLHAEVFTPRTAGPNDKLPTILLCHGWGGVAAHLRREGVAFARAGFLTIGIDYRGWGESDSRLITKDAAPKDKTLKSYNASVTEVRETVDPMEQAEDIFNAVHWVHGLPQCDTTRIGLWGSSLGGGLVVYVAAREPRIKALVSQVPTLDGRWVLTNPNVRPTTRTQATDRASGSFTYPRPGESSFSSFKGVPILDKFARFSPIEDVTKAKGCAMLFLLAENEELFDNRDHGILAHERALGPKKLVIVPDIKHYGIYREAHAQALSTALDWFNHQLK